MLNILDETNSLQLQRIKNYALNLTTSLLISFYKIFLLVRYTEDNILKVCTG